MADFRKWMIALFVLALFAGLASAQSNLIQCTPGTNGVPQLRGEGFTEEVGDIVIQCTQPAGIPLAPGSVIPTANFVVYLNGTVTSRLLGSSNSLPQKSEALLLIDEPQTPAAQIACGSGVGSTPGTDYSSQGAGVNGCTELVGVTGASVNTINGGPGANVFQGIVSGGAVTFFGVPVLPPATAGVTRTFHITNIRINANGLSGGGTLPASVIADVAIGSLTSPNPLVNTNYTVSITNPQLTLGFVSPSLNTAVYKPYSSSTSGFSSVTGLGQCVVYTDNGRSSGNPVALETVRFSELQGSAFKSRGSAPGALTQTIPGNNTFNTESGFTYAGFIGTLGGLGTTYAGLADWGTRLKAVFTNVPSGISLYVGTTNLNGSDNAPQVAPTGAPGYSSSFAQLIISETSPDQGLVPPILTATGTTGAIEVNGSGTANSGNPGPFSLVQIPIVGNTATAVWEVTNSLANTEENFDFEVYIYSNPAVSAGTPSPGTMSVNLSYAPTATQGAFTVAAGSVVAYNLGIPRFADTSKAATAATISICQTALLYPYVTEIGGFDTGLAVANTTSDPFGTGPQTGYCTIYWYGTATPATNPGYLGSAGYQTTTPTSSQVIATGTIQAWATSVNAPGFNGYVIALCNFQYAHGFAFVSDLGARNLAMGYLALVMNQGSGSFRPIPTGEALEN